MLIGKAKLDKCVDNYEQKASPLFEGLNLGDLSKAEENLETCAFVEPLRNKDLSKEERRADILGYIYSNPYKETWNYNKIAPESVRAINSGRGRFLGNFYQILKIY